MRDLQSDFSAAPRLFRIHWRDGGGPDLAVEAWWGCEALSGGVELSIDLLSTDARLELKRFLGRPRTLLTAPSDGSEFPRSGYVREPQSLEWLNCEGDTGLEAARLHERKVQALQAEAFAATARPSRFSSRFKSLTMPSTGASSLR